MPSNQSYFSNNKNLSVDKFFNRVLFDKKIGYYSSNHPFGKKGDFITSPGISNLFSEIIGIWIITVWHSFNKPKIFNLVFGILLSVLIYYINFFSNLLGENGKIPIILSIWLPLLILVLLSCIGLIRINEK